MILCNNTLNCFRRPTKPAQNFDDTASVRSFASSSFSNDHRNNPSEVNGYSHLNRQVLWSNSQNAGKHLRPCYLQKLVTLGISDLVRRIHSAKRLIHACASCLGNCRAWFFSAGPMAKWEYLNARRLEYVRILSKSAFSSFYEFFWAVFWLERLRNTFISYFNHRPDFNANRHFGTQNSSGSGGDMNRPRSYQGGNNNSHARTRPVTSFLQQSTAYTEDKSSSVTGSSVTLVASPSGMNLNMPPFNEKQVSNRPFINLVFILHLLLSCLLVNVRRFLVGSFQTKSVPEIILVRF